MEGAKYVYDTLGNIVEADFGNIHVGKLDIPEYNVIERDDDLTVTKAKQKKQRELYDQKLGDN